MSTVVAYVQLEKTAGGFIAKCGNVTAACDVSPLIAARLAAAQHFEKPERAITLTILADNRVFAQVQEGVAA